MQLDLLSLLIRQALCAIQTCAFASSPSELSFNLTARQRRQWNGLTTPGRLYVASVRKLENMSVQLQRRPGSTQTTSDEAANTIGLAIEEAVNRADASGQEAGKHIRGAAVEAWKHANSDGHEAAKTVGPAVCEAIKDADAFSQEAGKHVGPAIRGTAEWIKEHPGETAGIVACVVATPVAIVMAGQGLSATGFIAKGIAAGESHIKDER
jgi:hypothetical protein